MPEVTYINLSWSKIYAMKQIRNIKTKSKIIQKKYKIYKMNCIEAMTRQKNFNNN